MKYAYFDNDNDCICFVTHEPSFDGWFVVDENATPNDVYIKDGQLKHYPIKPSEYHDWDMDHEIWVDVSLSKLDHIQGMAIRHINNASSSVRDRFVTPISSQSTIYQLKKEQAQAYLADADPALSDYPLIAAEIGITGQDAFQVAQTYLNMNAIFMQALALVEQIRLTAVNSIENATERHEVDSAVLIFDQSIAALPF